MSEINYKEIGKRIRAVRKAQKLTQEEASERCDITSSYYGNLERGNKKMSVETLVKISKGLGVSADNLLFGEIPQNQELLNSILGEVRRNTAEGQFDKYLAVIKAVATVIDKL
jgi:transcriptional regulator with XRE-family HTH domain